MKSQNGNFSLGYYGASNTGLMTVLAKLSRFLLFASTLFFALEVDGQTTSQSRSQPEEVVEGWYSYRNAYAQLLKFEKFPKPKNLIQFGFQIVDAKGRVLQVSKLRIDLKSTPIAIGVDGLGRFELPLIRLAYQTNSEILFEVNGSAYFVVSVLSLRLRSDHTYTRAEMQKACDQISQFMGAIGDPRLDSKRCIGFYWISQSDESIPRIKGHPLSKYEPIQPNFSYSSNLKFYGMKFVDWIENNPIQGQASPLAILPIIE